MSVAARDALTLVFLGVGGYCLLHCVRAIPWSGGHQHVRLMSDFVHLGMSLAMVAMLWRPAGDRWGAQLAFFAAGCGWFLARATRSAAGTARPELLHQAVAMAAMFWMLSRAVVSGQPGTATAGTGMASMGTGLGGVAGSGTASTVTTLALAGYLSGAALWWLRRLRSRPVLVEHRAGPVGGQAPPMVPVGHTGASLSGPVFGTAADTICQAVTAAATAAALIFMR